MRIKIIIEENGEEIRSLSVPKVAYSRKRIQEFLKECEDEEIFK